MLNFIFIFLIFSTVEKTLDGWIVRRLARAREEINKILWNELHKLMKLESEKWLMQAHTKETIDRLALFA